MSNRKKTISIIGILIYIGIIVFCLANKISQELKEYSPEIAENNDYLTVGDPTIYGTDGNVEFSAYFLRDINRDGEDEKLLETFNDKASDVTLYSIDGEKEEYHGRAEPFYIKLKNRAGRLQNFNIRVYGSGYRFTTAEKNYSGYVYGGSGMVTQTSYFGNFFSFNDKNSTYIRDVSLEGHVLHSEKIRNGEETKGRIILTGTYINSSNQSISISKEIPLNVTWYGETNVDILNTSQTKDFEAAVDEENNTFTVNFEVDSTETVNEVELTKSFIGIGQPLLNGEDLNPINMNVTGGDATFVDFDSQRNQIVYKREMVEGNGTIWDDNERITKYNVEIVYSLDDIKNLGDDTLNIRVPVSAYYMDSETTTPYQTKIKDSTITVHYNTITTPISRYDTKVGYKAYEPEEKWVVSKDKPQRIYNGRSSFESNDLYTVRWYVNVEDVFDGKTLVMQPYESDRFVKSDSSTIAIENGTANKGIYFNNQENALGEDGWIKVYNNETNELLGTFTSENWFDYNAANPYKYNVAVRTIRVETSAVNSNVGLYVYHVKELYDEYITENYTKEEFEEFEQIESKFSTWFGEDFVITAVGQASYDVVSEEEPEENENSNLSLKIVKTEKDTENRIARVKYKVTGAGYENGRIVTTDDNGEIILEGLYLNEEYTLEETKAEGYYLSNSVKFKVENNVINLIEGTAKNIALDNSSVIPVAVIELEDEKIPTYTLQLEKIKRVKNLELSEEPNNVGNNEDEVEYLSGAEFKLYKDNKEIGNYITNSEGIITINDLYVYDQERGIDQTYVLKEIKTPSGYMKVKDITFRVEEINGKLEFIETLTEGQTAKKYTSEGTTVKVTVEDTATLKLINKDAETGELLSNIKFAIYNIDGEAKPARNGNNEIVGTKELIDGEEYYVLSTDENGEIVVDLVEGLYKAVELEAPDKYDISKSVYYFGIGADRKDSDISYGFQTQNENALGGTGEDTIVSMVKNQNGIVAIGTFEDTITLPDGTVLESLGSKDGMIISYDEQGNIRWARTVGGVNEDLLTAICTTQDNGVIVVGSFNTGVSLSNGTTLTNKGQTDGMIIKYNDSGIIQWAKRIGGTGIDNITSVVENENGDIFVGGYFTGTLTLDNNTTISSNGGTDGMLAKYSQSGEFQWIKKIGGTGADYIYSICETDNGDIIVGGTFYRNNTINLGNGVSITNPRYSDGAAIVRFSKDGSAQWSKRLGNTSLSRIVKLLNTKDNNVIVCFNANAVAKYDKNGNEIEKISLNYDSLSECQDKGILINTEGSIKKLNEKLETIWTRQISKDNNYEINSVLEKSTGEILVAGSFEDSIELKSGVVLTSNGNYDAMMLELKADNTSVPLVTVGIEKLIESDNLSVNIYEAIPTSDGGMIAYGQAMGDSSELENGIIINPGSIILKYNDDGELEWARSLISSANNVFINSIDEKNGNIIVSGNFKDSLYLNEYNYGSEEDESILKGDNNSENVGMLIIFNSEGELDSAEVLGKNVSSAISTSDGGMAVLAILPSNAELRNGKLAYIQNSSDDSNTQCYVLKYNRNKELEWIDKFENNVDIQRGFLVETLDKEIVMAATIEGFGEPEGPGMPIPIINYGILRKYLSNGELDWEKTIKQNDMECISGVCVTQDSGLVICGSFYEDNLQLENGIILESQGEEEGFLIKYNCNGQIEWAKSIGGNDVDLITSVCCTQSGDLMIGGYFYSDSMDFENGTTIENKKECDGMIVRYSTNGELSWAKSIGGDSNDFINSLFEKTDGSIIFNLQTYSSKINLGYGQELEAYNGRDKGILLNISENPQVDENNELIIENERKEFRITTASRLVNGEKHGSISGENETVYEIVKYGDSSTKPIVLTPNPNCELAVITVNGVEYDFTVNGDGTYTMPKFENVTENIHIVAEFTSEANTVIIKNPDSITGDLLTNDLSGTEFEIKQIGEEDLDIAIGEWQNIGQTYTEIDKSIDVTDEVLGEFANDNDHSPYHFVERNDQYIPTNSRLWQIENVEGATTGVQSSEAYSTVDIDLSNKTGRFIIEVNAEVFSEEESDIGHIEVYDGQDHCSDIAHLSGKLSAKNYYTHAITNEYNVEAHEELASLLGGKIYTLVCRYTKDSLTDYDEDYFGINSIKVYQVVEGTGELENVLGEMSNNTYMDGYFVERNGQYIPTTSKTYQIANVEGATEGVQNSTARSSIELDLSDKIGKYEVVINAEASCEEENDYGCFGYFYEWGGPEYGTVKLTGEQEAKDYVINLDGGQKYSLSFEYVKNNSIDEGNDCMAINSIKVYNTGYNAVYKQYGFDEDAKGRHVSNNKDASNSSAIACIPIDLTGHEGEYNLFVNAEISAEPGTRTETQLGWETLVEEKNNYASAIVSLDPPEYATYGINNISKVVTVFDKLNGNLSAKDYAVTLQGGQKYYLYFNYEKVNMQYLTGGDINIHSNSDELYNNSLNVIGIENHDIDIQVGAALNNSNNVYEDVCIINSIELEPNNSGLYKTTVKTTKDGTVKKQIPYGKYKIIEKSVTDKYWLNTDPTIIEFGPETGNEFSIENEKKAILTVHHYLEDTTEKVIEDQVIEDEIIGESYVTAPTNYVGNLKVIGRESNEQEENKIGYNEDTKIYAGKYTHDDIEVTYYYGGEKTPLTVHHYLQGTETPVPLADGTSAEDVTMKGKVGTTYETSPITENDLHPGYELVETPEHATGTYGEDEIVLTYYYGPKDIDYTVEYYYANVIDNEKTQTASAKYGSQVESYTNQEKTGYEFDKVENLPLTITENAEDNVIKVYYKKSDFNYTVEYYYDDEIDESKTETGTAEFESQVTTYEDKNITGYKFDKVENLPLTITENAEDNVIKVYYVLDDENTKALTYKVEYYKDGEKANTETERKVVQILASNTLEVDKSKINTTDKYSGYVFEKTDPEEIPDTVETGAVIKVYYVRKDAKVIVHHYYKNTTQKIVEDVEIDGKVFDEYTTSPSEDVPQNYTCVNEEPDKYTGEMTEEPIEVSYYYEVKSPVLDNTLEKTATANTTQEYELSNGETVEYAVLKQEDGEVTYEIKYTVKINEYIGNADIEIVDELPAGIDEEKSDLENGLYDETEHTITWKETLENIDTYENGEYETEITKTIKVVYSGQDLTADLVNKANAEIKLYYPEEDPAPEDEPLIEEETDDEIIVKQNYTVSIEVEKQWNGDEGNETKRPESIVVNVKSETGDFDKDYVISAENNWNLKIDNLNKYNKEGNLEQYNLTEKEANEGDLKEYDYKETTMEKIENNKKITYKYIIKNDYNPVVDLDAKMTKTGTNEMNKSNQIMKYDINFKSKARGNAVLTIVDELPYKIDKEKSDIADGIYDENTLTITWSEEINREDDEEYKIEANKTISLAYKDVDLSKAKLTNTVIGKIELKEFKGEGKATAKFDSEINVKGKVVVRYINKANGKELDKAKEIIGKVGEDYKTEAIEMSKYKCVSVTGNTTGKITEEDQEVIYYYELIKEETPTITPKITKKEEQETPVDTIKVVVPEEKIKVDTAKDKAVYTGDIYKKVYLIVVIISTIFIDSVITVAYRKDKKRH